MITISEKTLLLSICIPFYNRYENLEKIIRSIEKAKSEKFELLIIDNVSDREIGEVIHVDDSRIRIIRREKSVSPGENGTFSMSFAKGEFCLFILDKDYIDGTKLDAFIDALEKNKEIVGGYAVLNSKDENLTYKIFHGSSILQFGYLCKHPTGNIYHTVSINKIIKQKWESYIKENPFAPDILLAECANQGDMMLYEAPLMSSNLEQGNKPSKSYSYSKKDANVYFFPDNKIHTMEVFLKHADSLEIDKKTEKKLAFRIYYNTLGDVTTGIKRLAKNETLAIHYSYETWNVTKRDMYQNLKKQHKSFFELSLNRITQMDKIFVEAAAKAKFLLSLIRQSLKKAVKREI